ncbi:hypothetical protein DFS34DRAFT_691546 [Phlyctochytrium arcticum]|nr:hypothetical protein DFS34DRAFT_691546 [Phlyctochytrium arcticum]
MMGSKVVVVATSLLASTFLSITHASTSPPSSSISAPSLTPRNEEYQPLITLDFPHSLGYDRLKSWMNPKLDPCDDFYAYACGGFVERHKEVTGADVLELMQRSNSLLMEGILNQTSDALAVSELDRGLFDKTRAYYDSCRDTEEIKKRGFEPIESYAREIVENCQAGLSLPEMFGKLHQDGVYALFKTAYTKVENNDPNDLRLQFLPATAYPAKPHSIRKVLEPFLKRGILRLGPEDDLDDIVGWIAGVEHEMKKFIKSLNKGQESTSGLDKTQFMSRSQLDSATGMDWSAYVGPLQLSGADQVYFWGDTRIWIDTIKALKRYDMHDLQFYFIWRLAVSHFNKLSDPYYKMWASEIRPSAVRSTNDDPSDQSDVFQNECVTETGVQLNYLSGHLFVKYAFNTTQKHAATILVDNLISSFGGRLKNLDWMDAKTKEAAIAKLDNMIEIVGYPDWLADAETVSKYYESVTFQSKKYFENAVQAQVFSYFSPSIHQVGRRFQRDTLYFGYPWQLNAFHLTDYVQIQINPGILQRPLFSARNPESMNYGSLGMIIGHEITHGFDSTGYKLNKDGEKKPWWSSSSMKGFDTGAKCFVKQYNDYGVKFEDGSIGRVDGKLTLGENIADNGGLNVAYSAYAATEKGDLNTPEPGFDQLTKSQVFFLAFGQTWCTARDDTQAKYLLENDNHSPNPVRVNGVAQNSPEFAKAFGCKAGRPMNPKREKCFLY